LAQAILAQGCGSAIVLPHRVAVCFASMAGYTVRYGKSLCHLSSLTEAAQLMAMVQQPLGTSTASPTATSSATSFDAQVCVAAHELLDEINQFVNLEGKARKSLGTALRVSSIRGALGKDLLKEALFISAGADAFRHLVQTDMQETLSRVRQRLQAERQRSSSERSSELADCAESSVARVPPLEVQADWRSLPGIQWRLLYSRFRGPPASRDVGSQHELRIHGRIPGKKVQATPEVHDMSTQDWPAKRVALATQTTSTLRLQHAAVSTTSCRTTSRKTQTTRTSTRSVGAQWCTDQPRWISDVSTQTVGAEAEHLPAFSPVSLPRVVVNRFRYPVPQVRSAVALSA